MRGVYKVLVGKPGGKRLLGRAPLRWEDYIRMDLQRIGCEGVNQTDFLDRVRDRWLAVVNAI